MEEQFQIPAGNLIRKLIDNFRSSFNYWYYSQNVLKDNNYVVNVISTIIDTEIALK